MSVCFLSRDRTGVGLDGRGNGKGLGVLGEGETAVRIYCMKKTIFNKRKTERKQMLSKLSAGQGCFLPIDLALSQLWAEELHKVVSVVNAETDSWSKGQK